MPSADLYDRHRVLARELLVEARSGKLAPISSVELARRAGLGVAMAAMTAQGQRPTIEVRDDQAEERLAATTGWSTCRWRKASPAAAIAAVSRLLDEDSHGVAHPR